MINREQILAGSLIAPQCQCHKPTSCGHCRPNAAKPAWETISSANNLRLNNSVTGVNYYVCVYRSVCCMLRFLGGERIVDAVPGGTGLELRLRRGIWADCKRSQ